MTPNNPADDPRWDRLIHLVSGELPADEAEALRRWVEADPERREALAQLEEVWSATASPGLEPGAWDAEAELRRIKAVTGGAGRVIGRVGPNFERLQRRPSFVGAVLRVAAMIAVVAGTGLVWRHLDQAGREAPAPAVTFAEYRTPLGQRLAFRLPDGTQVSLAPGSVLRRPSTYGVRDRTVYLEGEGFFGVTHDSTRPFAVHTARTVARDLGTRFLVRAYQEDATTDIVVAEGVVAVRGSRSSDSLVLTYRQRATATADGRLILTSGVVLDPYLSWTQGRLVFQKTPLRDVVRQLERWYGVDIKLADPALGNRRLTAALEYESSPEAMDLVATSLELSLSRSGSVYLLRRRP